MYPAPPVTVARDSQRYILTLKVPPTITRLGTKMYEAASISPPSVASGTGVTVFSLCPTSDNKSAEMSIHTNLINAVSERVAKVTSRQDGKPINLSTTGVEVFNVLFKWLYSGQIPTQQPSTFVADEFWAAVFLMSRKLKVIALQVIAFEKFETYFRPRFLSADGDKRRAIPSSELLKLLFEPLNVQDAVLQSWMADHLFWMYNDKSSASSLNVVAKAIEPHSVLTTLLCTRLFATRQQRDESSLAAPPKHPSENKMWAAYRSLNLDESQPDTGTVSIHDEVPAHNAEPNQQSVEATSPAQEQRQAFDEMVTENEVDLKEESVRNSVSRAASILSDQTLPDDPSYFDGWLGHPPGTEPSSHRRVSQRQQRRGSRPSYDLKCVSRQMFKGV